MPEAGQSVSRREGWGAQGPVSAVLTGVQLLSRKESRVMLEVVGDTSASGFPSHRILHWDILCLRDRPPPPPHPLLDDVRWEAVKAGVPGLPTRHPFPCT